MLWPVSDRATTGRGQETGPSLATTGVLRVVSPLKDEESQLVTTQ